MTPSIELRHLHQGALPGDQAYPLLLQTYEIHFQSSPDIALDHIRKVLHQVLSTPSTPWPSIAFWSSHLPTVFTQFCIPEPSTVENQAWLEQWRKAPPHQQALLSENRKWSLEGWLHWLQPDQRTWYWWNTNLPSPTTPSLCHITLALRDQPCPIGSFRWLLKSAGALSITEWNPTKNSG